MVDIISIILFIVVAAVVLVVASLNKNSGNRSDSFNGKIIDVTPIYPKDDSASIKSENSEKGNISAYTKQITESRTKSKINSDIQIVSDYLESNKIKFNLRNNKNEKAYQDELFQQLRIAIPDSKPQIEQEKGRNRLDLLLYDSIGIELKIYNGEQTIRDLLYQINKYSKDYPFIIGLVINSSNRDNDLIKQDIDKDLSSLKQNNYKIIVK